MSDGEVSSSVADSAWEDWDEEDGLQTVRAIEAARAADHDYSEEELEVHVGDTELGHLSGEGLVLMTLTRPSCIPMLCADCIYDVSSFFRFFPSSSSQTMYQQIIRRSICD